MLKFQNVVIAIIKSYYSRRGRVDPRLGKLGRYTEKPELGPEETNFGEIRERGGRRAIWEAREWRTQQEQKSTKAQYSIYLTTGHLAGLECREKQAGYCPSAKSWILKGL